jgi:hypothetical protein
MSGTVRTIEALAEESGGNENTQPLVVPVAEAEEEDAGPDRSVTGKGTGKCVSPVGDD